MWLPVLAVLVAAHGTQHRRVEGGAHGGHRIGDGEGVAVEEEQEVVGVGLGDDLPGQQIRACRSAVRCPPRRGRTWPVVTGHALEVGHHPVRLVEVTTQVVELDIDPLGRFVVHGR